MWHVIERFGGVKALEFITDFYIFLVSVIFISFSGVMMPGPLFAVTIAKALKDKSAGVLISFGHGVIEFPLMFLIYFGFAQILSLSIAQKIVGLVGGLIMIYMGFQMIRTRNKVSADYESSRHGSLVTGIVATGANPYFLFWWATIGAILVRNAAIFGLIGFSVFAVIHWLCDLLWNSFVAMTVFKSKRFWTKRVYQIVLGFCFIVLTGFGVWFIISALL